MGKWSRFKQWLADKKEGIRMKKKLVCMWAKDHPDEAITLVSGMAAVTYKVVKTVKIKKQKEDANHPRKLFDPTLGCEMPLNRRMSDTDKRQFNRLVNAGMSRHEALIELGLIDY